MFKFLRSQAKVFYWVIAATFILFLFLGGLTGRGCQSPTRSSNQYGYVGSVNGTQISAQVYDNVLRQHLAGLKQQSPNRQLTENDYAMVGEQAWDRLVRQILVDQAIEDRGIEITDAEVLDVFQNDPLPELLYRYRDEAGNLDMTRYYADLQNPAVDWSAYEAYVREVLAQERLREMVTAGAVVTDEDVRKEYVRQTGRAVAEYMGALFADLPQDLSPSEEEVLAYFNEHRQDYQNPAQADCQAVRFAKEPSPADLQETLSFLQEIRARILNGEITFDQAARDYSEDGSAGGGGDLGTFGRDRMVAPFTEAAFSLQEGQISEPVRTKFGYHLIEVLERHIDQETDEVYQVHARHILLKVSPSPATLGLLQDRVEEYRSRLNASNFVSTAQAEAVELLDPPAFQKGQNIPELPQSLEGALWCFAVQKGRVSPVFGNEECLYILLSEGVTPERPATLDEVRDQVEIALKKQKEVELARAKLSPAVGEVQMGRPLAEVAREAGLATAVTDTFTASDNIPAVGWRTDFNVAALEGEVGQLIPEVETLRGLFALIPLWIKPIDENDFAARREGIRQTLLARSQGELFNQWLDDQVAGATIEDRRHTQQSAS